MSVVLITGASSGIGYALALAYARRGDHVVATARRADRLAALEAAINALPGHGDILTVCADAADSAAMQSAVDQAVARWGRLDVIIANAGVGQRGSIVDSDWSDLETLLRTNIDGVLHTIRAGVPALRRSGGGHIVLISSVVATMITPYAASYGASKAFVSNLARSLRLELEADHIGVTDVILGRTATEFNEKRLGHSGRAAKAPIIPVMQADAVAAGIMRAVERRQKRVVLRLFDRLILLGNALIPAWIGRRALKQYRT
ncbi:MAG: SDR family NAD(P)-dependent oxidoreductase [Anaerolinea sp.]|nr:SDR family NAD(P)-dependent oxidoreductase [Anaerolinea sp.]